jgi:hypothetical protein
MAAAQICDEGIALDEQAAPSAPAALRKDDWPAQQRARNLARELKRPNIAAKMSANSAFSQHRFEPPQDFFGQFALTPVGPTTPSGTQPSANGVLQAQNSESSQIGAWLIVFAGALALASGLGMIAWSLSTKVMTYWNLGFGLALGGQGTLVLGLALVISRLWRPLKY